jgi:serine/threonine protein kinase
VKPERWSAVNALFHAAVDLDPAAREELLRATAASDPDLVEEVRSLLARHEPGGRFLEAPAWAVAADLILDHESLVGKQIGSYQILRELGRGGMGVVYAARDERLGRTVALKALPAEYTRDRRHRDRLAREARAAAAFTHESIATVYALEDIDGALYIASELVEGQTLRDELAAGAVPPDRLIATLTDIASGLAAAHGRGIIHRDLKPENVIRRTDGRIKIVDFGLARISDPEIPTMTRLTEPGTTAGTPGYMAPEQISGGEIDARSDLFAFGVLAWELATGEHPFGSNPAIVLARMMEGRPASGGRQLPVPGLDPIVKRCLRASPEERYPSADVLLDDLRRLRTPSDVQRSITELGETARSGIWWWQFHQGMMIAVDAATPILAWLNRPSLIPSLRTQIFLAVLALATAAVTLRLNLLFTARVHPSTLVAHYAKLFRWIAGAESGIAILLLTSAAHLADARPGTAAFLVSLAIVMLASFSLIEPATSSGAGLRS